MPNNVHSKDGKSLHEILKHYNKNTELVELENVSFLIFISRYIMFLFLNYFFKLRYALLMILSSTGCIVRNRQNKDKVTYIDYIN